MHWLPYFRQPAQFLSPLPRFLFVGLLFASSVHAQIRENAFKNTTTRTSPREFRPLSSQPLELREGGLPLLAQATPPAQPGPTTPTSPAPGTGMPPGSGFGPGGSGFGSRFGGRGGSAGSAEETMRIEGDKVSLQFPNNTISDILGIYERLTNKTLIKDTAIFEGQTISLVTPIPVEKDEAIKLIEAALLTNGYAIVAEPGGKSSRILSTRTSTTTSGAQFSQGVKFYQSSRDLPDNETIVSFFMALTYLDPTEAATMLGGHVGLNPYGRITPVLSPPGLLITENANIVKQLVSIKEVIDAAASASALVTKFVALKYADAATVAQIVQATLNAQAQDKETKGITTIRGQGTSAGGSDGRPAAPAAAAAAAANNANSQKVRASSQVWRTPGSTRSWSWPSLRSMLTCSASSPSSTSRWMCPTPTRGSSRTFTPSTWWPCSPTCSANPRAAPPSFRAVVP